MPPFLNRTRELARLRAAFDSGAPLVTVYGRRRIGKSRLLREALGERAGIYFSGDTRDSGVQRAALAAEVGAVLPGFGDVHYPDWSALLARLYRDSPTRTVLVLDEFTDLVAAAPELPSVLRNQIDSSRGALTVAISGSSQSMMHSLVLDALQPLFGRSTELLRLTPMPIGWMARALGGSALSAVAAVETWAVIGGVPRYWELFLGRPLWDGVLDQILDPYGPLNREPERLLRDELTDHRRAASILALIGAGCHRLCEIAGRIGVPSADLSRPLRLLIDVGFVSHDVPFGKSARDTRRTVYDIADPFLRFWFRFVEPNRSQLEAGNTALVARRVEAGFAAHLGAVWEDLARAAMPHLARFGQSYEPASRWWGSTPTGPVELDLVAKRADHGALVIGEAKLSAALSEVDRLIWDLEHRASRVTDLPATPREPLLFVLNATPEVLGHPRVVGPAEVIAALGGVEAGWSAAIPLS